jgi:Fe-Mn family superoxide dismutase
MKFELTELPYDTNAFEPYISKTTFEYHHGKLQSDYVTTLNKIVIGTEFKDSNLENIIKIASGTVYTYASLVWNHSFYFEGLKPGFNSHPKGSFAEIVKKNFGSLAFFKKAFINAANSLSVSGWIWLVLNNKGVMEIIRENQAGNPLREGLVPLLNCDIWEHAYYLDYQNRRLDYINSFLGLINWDVVEERYLNTT